MSNFIMVKIKFDFFGYLNSLRLYRLDPYLKTEQKLPRFELMDLICMIILSMVGFYARLFNFQHPDAITFDECHFGNFTNGYLRNEYFFDIHPPFAKLQFAFFSWLQEYDGSINFGDEPSTPYPDESYVAVRIAPVMYSSMVPAVIYLVMRFAVFSKVASFTAGFLIAVETSIIAEGKYLFTDGTLHLYTMIGVIFIHIFNTKSPRSEEWWKWMKIASIFISLGFSIKNTALSLCILIMYTQVIEIMEFRNYFFDSTLYSEVCTRIWHTLWPGLAVHMAIWAIHFMLLHFSTPDSNITEIEFFNLVNRTTDDGTQMMWHVIWPPVIFRIFTVLGNAIVSNGLNYEPHPCMSRPQDWPLMTDIWVSYYGADGAQIACAGNYFVYIMSFIGVLGSMCCIWHKKYPMALRLIVGYWVSYLPFFGVPRTMFLYHYQIPLMFAACCAGCLIDMALPKFWRGYAAVLVCSIAFVGYIIFNPFIYGRPDATREWRLMNKAWRDGKPGKEKWIQKMEALHQAQKKASDEEDQAIISSLARKGKTLYAPIRKPKRNKERYWAKPIS